MQVVKRANMSVCTYIIEGCYASPTSPFSWPYVSTKKSRSFFLSVEDTLLRRVFHLVCHEWFFWHLRTCRILDVRKGRNICSSFAIVLSRETRRKPYLANPRHESSSSWSIFVRRFGIFVWTFVSGKLLSRRLTISWKLGRAESWNIFQSLLPIWRDLAALIERSIR